MALIQHRVNKISEVKVLKSELGAEIDLRSNLGKNGEIHLSHDAWVPGDLFQDWLNVFSKEKRAPLILNTKEDGLEKRALEMVRGAGIKDFFFLDTTIPTLKKLANEGLSEHLCMRFSKFEPADFLKLWVGKVAWVWVDCFDGELVLPSLDLLKKFKVCLVSPELQMQSLDLIPKFKEKVQGLEYSVCTKRPDLWK